MAFVGALIAAGGTIVGGLLGRKSSKKGATDQTQNITRTLDPRLDDAYFGSNGQGGLLGDLGAWYAQNKSGLNQQMLDGLNQQNAVYRSPLATRGYERMGQTGYNLMGRGVAGNPFTSGQQPQFGNWGARQYSGPQPQNDTGTSSQNLGFGAPSMNANFGQPPANQSNEEMVAQAYQQLGRAPDPEGAAWWVNALKTGGVTPQNFMTEFMKGAQKTGGSDASRASQYQPYQPAFSMPVA